VEQLKLASKQVFCLNRWSRLHTA